MPKTDAELLELHKRALHFAASSRVDYQAGCQLILDFIEVLPDLLARAARLETSVRSYTKTAEMLDAENDRLIAANIALEDRLEEAEKALRKIKACSMSREQFMPQGPAFACRQVERVVGIASDFLARFSTPSEEGRG